jgi:hypothetical protein
MARHVASPRLVPQANRLGLAWYSQAESALARLECRIVIRSRAEGGANLFRSPFLHMEDLKLALPPPEDQYFCSQFGRKHQATQIRSVLDRKVFLGVVIAPVSAGETILAENDDIQFDAGRSKHLPLERILCRRPGTDHDLRGIMAKRRSRVHVHN